MTNFVLNVTKKIALLFDLRIYSEIIYIQSYKVIKEIKNAHFIKTTIPYTMYKNVLLSSEFFILGRTMT